MRQVATFKLTAIAAALLAVHGFAAADEAEDLVRQLTQPDSSLTLGVGHLDGARSQLGKYDGMNQTGIYGLFGADLRRRDNASGTWSVFSARNLGLDNREFKGLYERQGDWGATLDYSETPARNPNAIVSGATGIGTTRLQYGAIATAAGGTQAALYPRSGEAHLTTKRESTTLSVVKYLMPDLVFNASFKNEDKKGAQMWGRGVNPEFAAQPVDWNTQQLDATLGYNTRQFQLLGGISASWFKNANSYVDTVGGSQTSAAGANFSAGHTFLSLPLDNEALQYFVDGGYNFAKHTRATFKLSHARAKQNDNLAALSDAIRATGATGSSNVDPAAPASLNAVVDSTTLNFAVSSNPVDKLSLVAKLDHNQRKDKTPVQVFSTTAIAGGQTNNPHGFTKQALRFEGSYRLPDGYHLTAGVDDERRKHDLAFANDGAYEGTVKLRARTDELTWRLQVRRSMSETLNGTLAYLHSKRDGSAWPDMVTEMVNIAAQGGVAYTDVSPITIPWTNPFAFADRKRDKWRVMLDWAPAETTSLQLNYERSADDYEPAKSGLQSGRAQLLSLDASVALDKDWTANAWVSQDVNKAHQIGITYDPRTVGATLRDSAGTLLTTLPGSVGWLCSSANSGAGQCTTDLAWDMNLKDTNNAIGIGVKGKALAKLTVGANVQWSQATSRYPASSNVPDYNTGANGAANANRSRQGLPDITTTTTTVALYGQYALQKDMDLRVDVAHQRWKTNDWTWMVWNAGATGMMPFSYMDGTQVVQPQRQASTFVGVSLSYKFR